MKAVLFKDVYFSIEGYPILENVNLEIEKKGFYVVIGPNGGGKTTLLKLILGLYRPTKGEIRVFDLDPSLQRSKIGYMPQHILYDKKFPVNVLDVVLMGRLGRKGTFGPFKKEDKEKALSALKMLGIEGLSKKPFFSLSGGERQRVLIARAIVSEPSILLLDEPSANIDMAFEENLYEFLFSISRNIPVLVVTHDLGFVSRYIDQCICVNKKVFTHPLREITVDLLRSLYQGELKMVSHGLFRSS